jgi:isocitrate dehydrogenase
MTKDLAILVHGEKVNRNDYLSTEEFLSALKQNLETKLSE